MCEEAVVWIASDTTDEEVLASMDCALERYLWSDAVGRLWLPRGAVILTIAHPRYRPKMFRYTARGSWQLPISRYYSERLMGKGEAASITVTVCLRDADN